MIIRTPELEDVGRWIGYIILTLGSIVILSGLAALTKFFLTYLF